MEGGKPGQTQDPTRSVGCTSPACFSPGQLWLVLRGPPSASNPARMIDRPARLKADPDIPGRAAASMPKKHTFCLKGLLPGLIQIPVKVQALVTGQAGVKGVYVFLLPSSSVTPCFPSRHQGCLHDVRHLSFLEFPGSPVASHVLDLM